MIIKNLKQFSFKISKLLTEIDQKSTKSHFLVAGKGNNAGEVEFLTAVFFLGEISHKVETVLIILSYNIEEEGLYIIVEGLMIQEKFGYEA